MPATAQNSNRYLAWLRWLLAEQAMLVALVILIAVLSVLTWDKQSPTGAVAGQVLAARISGQLATGNSVAILTRSTSEDLAFATELKAQLEQRGFRIPVIVNAEPPQARAALEAATLAGQKIDLIAASEVASSWTAVQRWAERQSQPVMILKPQPYYWPNFLKTDNLLNISNQIAVIAIIAIGMTMVIITGGVDLSVGSLIALSAVICTILLRDLAGGQSASLFATLACSLAAIGACALFGAVSGTFVTLLRVPSFIVTLAMMLLADGVAYNLSQGATIDEIPRAFMWLGKGTALVRIPNSAVLMIGLYVVAQFIMTKTIFGRHLYAVGGNLKAAWLCGVPVKRVTIAAYIICAALAGLGGVLMASQLGAGSPNYGSKHELMVIAAVVVGGTSLAGGRGTMWGTFIGALILAVIANGMNLVGLESKRQQIVLGMVILSAVLLDRMKRPPHE
ncbi:Ribose transport system permease protein RbsC [Anatilimnocola aggregata]|uniref:Ribose transport system permease protein RbsC n=1 Tax=Anatilimnocola aggregata TaxID=2528021 RepID=A0A517YGN9_9BACT|nr:ABC transporter permease [Anatilimnocola aggregata]QDU29379.1 Ribose transport system permease protein RbsC [Anatilimnocola aggregata]